MKKLLIISLFIFFCGKINAQTLSFQVKGTMSLKASMIFNPILETTDFAFYFPNEYNETILFNPSEAGEYSAAWTFFPGATISYNSKNNVFANFEVMVAKYDNRLSFANTVIFPDYVEAALVYDKENPTEAHSELSLKMLLTSYGVNAGYRFLRTKSTRPYLSAGLFAHTLNQFGSGPVPVGRDYRSDVIFEGLNTYNRLTFVGRVAAGISYYSIDAEFSIDRNLSKLDSYELPYYQSLTTYQVSIAYKLYGLNLASRKTKRKIEKLIDN